MKDDGISITLSDMTADTMTLDSTLSGPLYISDSMAPPIWSTIDTITIPNTLPQSTLTLTGDDADIMINGVSLVQTLQGMQQQLNMLAPDPAMEQEWDELRRLREQYEAKLAECREKSQAWRALQQSG